MKRTLLFFALQCGCAALIEAQVPSFQWARTCSSVSDRQLARKVVCDRFGSVYLLGFNYKTATFPDHQLDSGYFMAKYRHDGDFLWSRQLPGNIVAMESDNDGFIYIAGNYFGSITLDQGIHHSQGEQDFFLARLNGDGSVSWSESFGGTSADGISDIAISKDNLIHIGGATTGPLSIQKFPVKDTGFFIAQLNSASDVQWIYTKGSYTVPSGDDQSTRIHTSPAYEIATDNAGNVYVIRELPNAYYAPAYALSKYSSIGEEVMDKPFWGTFEFPGSLTFDRDDNMFVMYNTGSHYMSNIVITKYDSNLQPLWSRGLGNGYCNYKISSGMTLDKEGNVTVTGWIGGSTYSSHDTVTIDSVRYAPYGSLDAAVWQFDGESGKTRWLKRAGGKGADFPYGICSDPAGNLFVASIAQHFYHQNNNPSHDTCIFDQLSLPISTKNGQVVVAKIRTSDFEFQYDAASLYTVEADKELRLFPNPGNGNVFWNEDLEDAHLTVSDISGRLIIDQKVKGRGADLSKLNDGLYLIRLSSEQAVSAGIYIKE